MTRKRFIKLLMGNGAGRNEAEEAARELRRGESYRNVYQRKRCRLSAERMGKACLRLARSTVLAASSMQEALKAIENAERKNRDENRLLIADEMGSWNEEMAERYREMERESRG